MIPITRLSTSLPAAVAFAAAAASLSGQGPGLTFRHATIARTGDPSPHRSGARFDRFGLLPGVGGAPIRAAIDERGRIAFHAYLGDGNPATPPGGEGIFKEGGVAVAVTGDPAPGTNSTFAGFPNLLLAREPDIHAGQATFLAAVLGGLVPVGGIWSERSGTLARVLLATDTLPDTPPGSTVFEVAHTLRGSSILVNVRYALAGAGGVGTDTEGLWIDAGGGFQTIAAKGVPAPGTGPGVVFDSGTHHALFGPIDAWNANRLGEAIFNAYLGGPGIDVFNDEGIWVGSPGNLALVVREGQPVPGQPGVRFGAPGGFRAFARPAESLPPTLNERGTLLFGAVLQGPGSDHVAPAFLVRNGQIRILARASSSLPGTPPGDPAAGFPAPATYANFSFGIVNNSDDVVLFGAATTGNPLTTMPAIWRDRGTGLELVAGVGRPVPAIPGLTFTSVLPTGFSDLGLLYYTGTMTGAGTSPANDGALFVMDAEGRHAVVLREGDPFDLSGNGSDVRVLANVVAGSGVADGGAKAVTLTFIDGSLAIAKIEPELALVGEPRLLSAASGGTVGFQLFASTARAGRPYVLAGSASGTRPGLALGGLVVPLNLDAFLLATLGAAPQLPGFVGVFDTQGRATASLPVGPLPPQAVGLGLHFAYVVANPLDSASNPVPVTVVP